MTAAAPGVDLVDVARFGGIVQRRGRPFLERLFTPRELACVSRTESLAAGFAAKEAFLKALGTGLARGVGWHDVEVLRDEWGAPRIEVRGAAAGILSGRSVGVSMSHTASMAIAVVVLGEGD